MASILFILTAATILAITVFPGLLFPKDVEVSDVSGMTIEKAEDTLKKAGFTVASEPIEIADEKKLKKGLSSKQTRKSAAKGKKKEPRFSFTKVLAKKRPNYLM
ncbi:hypothetical protein BsIDN1_28700 [Bacillus safensis]|uniref:PASTA domain-containing protein n=1 Tax=Bacillus safensis TaxID=561879 RepID=A0A5S9M9J0_BACIA|nr:hypothetical protein BsIDN1_28700 [Bacillus safensis]